MTNNAEEYNESYIKEICEQAARLCRISAFPTMSYEEASKNYWYGVPTLSSTSEENVKPKILFPEMMFNIEPNVKNLVRDWDDLNIGEKYYVWAEKRIKNPKIYILKHIITELNGDVLNICVMKQCSKSKTKMFTLTENDCKHIGIKFETGLEVYPINIGWIKYKNCNQFNERLDVDKINVKDIEISKPYKYHPTTKEELKAIIKERIVKEGDECDLNDIDTSQITNMSELFKNMKDFNGDIRKWDVSNVTNMFAMFARAESFNGDISRWNVSNVTNMSFMFCNANSFNGDISNWNVSNVIDMNHMFDNAKSFDQDISNWNVSNLIYKLRAFDNCSIKKEYRPKFNI